MQKLVHHNNKYCGCVITDMHNNVLVETSNTYEKITIHAEMNAVKELILKNKINEKINIYLSKSPCIKCYYVLKHLNIDTIYYLHEYKNDYRLYNPKTILNSVKINIGDDSTTNIHTKMIKCVSFERKKSIIMIIDRKIIRSFDIIENIFELLMHDVRINNIYVNTNELLVVEKIFLNMLNINYFLLE